MKFLSIVAMVAFLSCAAVALAEDVNSGSADGNSAAPVMLAANAAKSHSMAASAEDVKQIDAGSVIIGGVSTSGLLFGNHTLKPQTGDATDASTIIFALVGYGGYFVIDGLEVGGALGLATTSLTAKQGPTNYNISATIADVGPQAAYIFNLGANQPWAPFVQLELGYAGGSLTSATKFHGTKTNQSGQLNGFDLTPRGGAMFFLSKKFALDLSFFVKYIDANGYFKTGTGANSKQNESLSTVNYGILVGFNGFLK